MIPDWAEEREHMVERQLRRRGIRDTRVLEAVRTIPREQFVPVESRMYSYQDEPISIGYGQTISHPYMTALMAELLALQGTETVLDIGSGSGYHAAVLGALAARVISLEIIPELARQAERNLQRSGRGGNVKVVCADGSKGWPEDAPYQAISAAAAAPDVPAPLIDQLDDPGRLVIPVGEMMDQELRVVEKCGGRIEYRVATFCRFVPLRGDRGWQ